MGYDFNLESITPSSNSPALKRQYDVVFDNIEYSVILNNGLFQAKTRREILHGLSGEFRSGELSTIIGASGAGKSSLFNILSGLIPKSKNVDGVIQIDRQASCYLTQEDNLRNAFTVEQYLRTCCNLKLEHQTSFYKQQVMLEIIQDLQLQNCLQTHIKKLSGGERKRLSIALELISKPNILFLDEPTSGLDEVSAWQCMRMLSKLSKQGKTMVCTVHQPSEVLLSMFDKIYVLCKGQCVYQGAPNGVISLLQRHGWQCPKTYNAIDYLLELCENEEIVVKLARIMQNGQLQYCAIETIQADTVANSIVQYEHQQISKANVIKSNRNKGTTGALHSFGALLRMMWQRMFRERLLLAMQMQLAIFTALCFGMMCWNAGSQAHRLFDVYKLIDAFSVALLYAHIIIPVFLFPTEFQIVKLEVFNRWYKLGAYYLSLHVARAPLMIVSSVFYIGVLYYMCGFPVEWLRIAMVFFITCLHVFICDCVGHIIGTIYRQQTACIISLIFMLPTGLFTFYGVDFMHSMPYGLRLLMNTSLTRIHSECFLLLIYDQYDTRLHCPLDICHHRYGKDILKFLDIKDLSKYLMLIMGYFVLSKILHYVVMKWKCK